MLGDGVGAANGMSIPAGETRHFLFYIQMKAKTTHALSVGSSGRYNSLSDLDDDGLLDGQALEKVFMNWVEQ